MVDEAWVEAELVRLQAVQRYQDTPGQIAGRRRDVADAALWRNYR